MRVSFTPSDAPAASSGTAARPTIKDVAVTAPSGDATAVGVHTNRWVRAASPGNVELITGTTDSDSWVDVDLVENATATDGVTVVANAIVSAQAKLLSISGALYFTQNSSGGGSRLYVDVRLQRTRGSTVTTPAKWASRTYSKITAVGASLTQGPDHMIAPVIFTADTEAGDSYKIQVKAWSQGDPGGGVNLNVDLVGASSGVEVVIQ